jgi:flagellar biosynthesis chaperone FliJ
MRYFLAGICATIRQTVSAPVTGRNVTELLMASNLAVLLNLRRAAEEEAQKAQAEAVATRLRAEEEQQRLDSAAEQARHALEQDTKQRTTATAAEVVADGLLRERYRQRLTATLARAMEKAVQHQQGPLELAQAAQHAAAARVRQARQERQAIEKLMARQEADQHKQAQRRAEDAAGDWVQSSQNRRKPRG